MLNKFVLVLGIADNDYIIIINVILFVKNINISLFFFNS